MSTSILIALGIITNGYWFKNYSIYTDLIASIISKKADLTTSDMDMVPRRTDPLQQSGLLFSQQVDGLGTRKRTRVQLTREESPMWGIP